MTTKTLTEKETEAALKRSTESLEGAPKRCVVLLSGGLDSTVSMYSLVADYEVWPLTINYGQSHSKEVIAARNVCEARGDWLLKRWRYLDLSNLRFILPSALTGIGEVPEGEYDKETMSQTYVPNRNMIFLAVAAGYAEGVGAAYVAYAAHAEDHYLYSDCRPEFAIACNKAIEQGTGGKVRLLTPFIGVSKADIITFGRTFTVPFKLTWSCYKGMEIHCGLCSTCIERKKAFKKAGVPDPTKYADGQESINIIKGTEHPEEFSPIVYKEFYNRDRGLPEPEWGQKMSDISPDYELQCPTCGSREMYASASPDDPEEIFPHETVRCKHCGRITDWYEAHEQRINHPTDKAREVTR